MLVRFKGSPGFPRYHDNPDWQDGDERNVSEELAQYLSETFPDHFSVIESQRVEKMVDAPPNNKIVKGPKDNK